MKNVEINLENLNWSKVNNLIPAIVQDSNTLQVLMLGYMDKEAILQTCSSRKITFYSRTRNALWVKGETSGNELILVDIQADCDNDSLLLLAKPSGPCCHLNTRSCFGKADAPGLGILAKLESLLEQRYQERPADSYTSTLFNEGIRRIAQKVGEEGVEVALASMSGLTDDIKYEAADLLFHLLVLLKQSRIELNDVLLELQQRFP